MRSKLFALLICALIVPTGALAQARPIPDNAVRGKIVYVRDTMVEVDGKPMRLAAGAQTRNQNNLIIVPSSLPPGAVAKYTLDGAGQIHRVWLLTAEETAAPDKKP